MSRTIFPPQLITQSASRAAQQNSVSGDIKPVSLEQLPQELVDHIVDSVVRERVPYEDIAAISSAFRQTALAHAKHSLLTAPKLARENVPFLLQADYLRLHEANQWLTKVAQSAAPANASYSEIKNGTGISGATKVSSVGAIDSNLPLDPELDALQVQLERLGPQALRSSLNFWAAKQPSADLAAEAVSRIVKAYQTREPTLNLQSLRLTSVPEVIGQIVGLQELNISDNHLSVLTKSIVHLPRLRKLNASRNQISELPEDIGKLVTLQELSLSRNRLSALPASSTGLRALEYLEIDHNNFSRLPECIGQLARLRELTVSANHLTSLTDAIGGLSELRKLDASHNQISVLPEFIGQLSSLRELSLTSNQLSTLPDSLTNLRDLRVLEVDSNSLVTLPDHMGQMRALRIIDLSSNQLLRLPDDMGEMVNLQTLSVLQNQISRLPEPIKLLLSNGLKVLSSI